MTRAARDPYLEVGQATRAAIEAAATNHLSPLQHRALLAVIHFTATYSRFATTAYLGQIASITYGVDRAEEWQLKKTRVALGHLQELGIIAYAPPRGRPSRPSYWVSIRPTDTPPSRSQNQDRRSTPQHQDRLGGQTVPEPGPSTPVPIPSAAGPDSGSEPALAGPDSGPPTEVSLRDTEVLPRARGGSSHGPAEGGPTTTTPTEAERRDAARHAITTGTTHNPLAHAYSALTRPDPQGEIDDGYLDELEHAIRQWTYGVTEAETAIALDTLDRTDHGTHPLQAAHQAATTWATHPARDHDPTQIPRPPKDLP